MTKNNYEDPDFDLKESFLILLMTGISANEIAIFLGIKQQKVVGWLKTDRNFNKKIMEITRRDK